MAQQHAELRERIEEWMAVLRGRDSGEVRSDPSFWIEQACWAKRLLRDCLAVCDALAGIERLLRAGWVAGAEELFCFIDAGSGDGFGEGPTLAAAVQAALEELDRG